MFSDLLPNHIVKSIIEGMRLSRTLSCGACLHTGLVVLRLVLLTPTLRLYDFLLTTEGASVICAQISCALRALISHTLANEPCSMSSDMDDSELS